MANVSDVLYLDFPLEQLVRRRGVVFQLAFAAPAKALVPAGEEFLLHASHKGLHILARSEEALARPIEVLREAFGDSLVVAPPRVRLIEGAEVQEPIMHLRISLQARDAEAVKRALARRGATLTEEYRRAAHCVLRYEAPMADLLGLPAELERLTGGTSRHSIALSRYGTVDRGPGGDAA